MRLKSFVMGGWQVGDGRAVALCDASTGALVAEAASEGIDFGATLRHAREVGGASCRERV